MRPFLPCLYRCCAHALVIRSARTLASVTRGRIRYSLVNLWGRRWLRDDLLREEDVALLAKEEVALDLCIKVLDIGVLDLTLSQLPSILRLCKFIYSAIQFLQEPVLIWAFDVTIVDLVLPFGGFQALHTLWLYELIDESDTIGMFGDVCTLGIAHCLQFCTFPVFFLLRVNCFDVDVLHSKATMMPVPIGLEWVSACMSELWSFLFIPEPICRCLTFQVLLRLRDCLCKLFYLLVPCHGFTPFLLVCLLYLHSSLIRHGL